MSIRDQVVKTNQSDIKKTIEKNTSDKKVDKFLTSSKYMPLVYSTELDSQEFPNKVLLVRVLPALSTSPHKVPLYKSRYYNFFDLPIENADKYKWFLPDEEECKYNFDSDLENNPIAKLRSDLYKNKDQMTEEIKKIANKLFPRTDYLANVLIRKILLHEDDLTTVMCRNVGPRIAVIPKAILTAINTFIADNDSDCDPFDIDNGYDIKWQTDEKQLEGKKKTADYSKSRVYSAKPCPIGTEEEIERILGSLHDLTAECQNEEGRDLQRVADSVRNFIIEQFGFVQIADKKKYMGGPTFKTAQADYSAMEEVAVPQRSESVNVTRPSAPATPRPTAATFDEDFDSEKTTSIPSNSFNDEDDDE